MNILVTGSAGFIGFHLVQALLDQGNRVIGIDNLNDYYDPSLKLKRLEEINKNRNPKHKFIKMDISNKSEMKTLFKENSFDIVINLAAQAGVRYSLENPHAYVDSNLVGFVNILEGCRSSKVKHLVYASSSSVYGMNIKQPFSPNDRTDYPISLYAATKKSNELMAYTYSHLFNIPTTGLRFFTVYGPYGRPDMAYFKFTKKIINEEYIDVYNDGNLERDFTYIDDIISGIIKIKDLIPSQNSSKYTDTLAPYKIYNIGNNNPVKLRRFISSIEKACGKKAKENFMPMQPGDVLTTYANIEDLQKDIGFTPSTSIEEGISKFVSWYMESVK